MAISNAWYLNRRQFLKRTGGMLIGASAGTLLSPHRAHAVSANEKIVVAHVGVGGMGNGHVSAFASFPDVEVAAVCDVDETHRLQTLSRLQKIRPDTRAVAVDDFRRLLDRSDIDVITCATPDHWHALVAILAMQAGKDVYGEKPLSHTLAEGQAMVRACNRYGRVFQLGTQIHAGENYHRVVDLLRAGVLGKIHTVRVWKEGGSPGLGYPADQAPPSTLDWNMWLGPAPWHEYNPVRCHGTFRYFWDYSGGIYADFWCHISDLVFWALAPRGLRRIYATGTTPDDGIAETPRAINVEYEFENLRILWSSSVPDVPGAQGRGIGAQFVGEKGSLVADYGSHVIFLDGKQYEDIPEVANTLPRSPGHHRNFLDCVRSRARTESPVDYAFQLTTPMYLGLIAFRLGRPLQWDPERQQFIGDEAANRMLYQPYRAPWSLPL